MVLISVLYIVTLIASTVIAGWLGFYVRSRRNIPTVRIFCWLMLDFVFMDLAYLLQDISPTLQSAEFFGKIRFVGLAALPVVLLLFVLAYIGRDAWLQPKRSLFLWIVPLLTQVVVWADHGQGLFFQNWSSQPWGIMTITSVRFTGLFGIYVTYAYCLIVFAIVLLTLKAAQTRGLYRAQALTLILGIILALLFNIVATLYASVPTSLENIPNPTPLGFAIGACVLAIALFRYSLLTVLPIANDLVVEAMSDAVIVVDLDSQIVGLNPAAEHLIGQRSDKLIGQPVRTVFPDWLKPLAPDFEGTEEISVAQADYEVKFSPIRQRNQRLIGRLMILREITQRKLAQQRASELALEHERVKLLASFVQNMAHELRTPLTVINMKLYLLQKDLDTQARTQHVGAVTEQVERMTMLLNQMGQMVNLDLEPELIRKPLSLNLVCDYLPSLFEALIAQKHLTLTWETAPKIALVLADEKLLVSAFQNLLHNAILYTQEGGQICVRTGSNPDSSVFIEVSDNGMGIDADTLPYIFDRFYKANTARTLNGSGMGLGLAMVKKIMDLHNGQVIFVPPAQRGSTFRLVFPAAAEQNL